MQYRGSMSTCIIEAGYHSRRWRQRERCSKKAISIALLPSPSLPLQVPQVSLRDTVSLASLRSERSVHHIEWILSVLLPEDQGTTVKQNKTGKKKKKSHNTWTAHLPNLIYAPALLPPAEEGMLDQFVIQQPHHSKPLSTLALSYPNPVLRLLKVHAAAHPSVCPYPNFGFHHTNPSSPLSQWSASIFFPRDKAQL